MSFDRDNPFNELPFLPPGSEVESKLILKKAILASRALAELKKKGHMLPKQEVLISSLVLLEAKDSSEIENIFTTHDKIFKAEALKEQVSDANTKEVSLYSEALWAGVEFIKEKPLSTNTFVDIYQIIKKTSAGIRTTTGTKITTPSGKLIYTPPEGEDLLRRLLKNLEDFIHDDDIDPLIKMAILHYQFEAIHPFTDGNGRTGRILNILYLLQAGLLEMPLLFLSSYIINNKTAYYKGLRGVTESQDWEGWILYMLEAVECTANHTISRIEEIENLMDIFSIKFQKEAQNLYTKELVELLFEAPFHFIGEVSNRLNVQRQTASVRLKKLHEIGLLEKYKVGNHLVYCNSSLYGALKNDYFSDA